MGARWLNKEGPKWVQDGLLTTTQWENIQARYTQPWSAGTVLAWMASMFIGIGILSIVAANWDTIPPSARTTLLLCVLIALQCTGIWANVRGRHVLSASLIGLGVITFGGALILIGQTYHLTAYSAITFYVWASVALLTAYVLRSTWISVLGLLLLTSGTVYAAVVFDAFSIFSSSVLLALGFLFTRMSPFKISFIVVWTVASLAHVIVAISLYSLPPSWYYVALLALACYAIGATKIVDVRRWIEWTVLANGYVVGLIGMILSLNSSHYRFSSPVVTLAWFVLVLLYVGLVLWKKMPWKLSSLFLLVPVYSYMTSFDHFMIGAIHFSLLISFGLLLIMRGLRDMSRFLFNWGTALTIVTTTVGFFVLAFSTLNGFSERALLFIIWGLIIWGIASLLRHKQRQWPTDSPVEEEVS